MALNKKLYKYILILSIMTFYIINNHIWFKSNGGLVTNTDSAFHMKKMFDDYYPLKGIRDMLKKSRRAVYPPVYNVLASISMHIFGSNLEVSVFQNMFWLLIAMIGLYWLASAMFDEITAIFSVFIFSMLPAVYGYSRLFAMEYAAMSVIIINMFFLYMSNGLTSKKYTYLFFITAAFGMMIRLHYLLFITGPFLYILFFSIRGNRLNRAKVINILIGTAIFILILKFRVFSVKHIQHIAWIPFNEKIAKWYEFTNLRLYTVGLLNYQLGPVFFACLLLSCCSIMKNEFRSRVILLLLWILPPVIFLTFMPHRKCLVYILPYLPAIAVLISAGLRNSRLADNSYVKTVIIILALLQYYEYSFGVGWGIQNLNMNILGKDIRLIENSPSDPTAAARPPVKDNIMMETKKIIEERYGMGIQVPKLLILPMPVSSISWDIFYKFDIPDIEAVFFRADNKFLEQIVPQAGSADYLVLADENEINTKEDIMSYMDRTAEIIKDNIYMHSYKSPPGFMRRKMLFENLMQTKYDIIKSEFSRLIYEEFQLIYHKKNYQNENVYFYKRVKIE